MKFKPRIYQQNAIDAVLEYILNAPPGYNPLIALPTGTGKSIVIAHIIAEMLARFPRIKFLMLTHVKELVEQNASKFITDNPMLPTGICSAGLNRYDTNQPIIFGGVGSVVNRVDRLGVRNIVIIDECHLVSTQQSTSYMKIIKKLLDKDPFLKVIGLSATPYRMKSGSLTNEGGIFTDVCFNATTPEWFKWFIDNDFMAPLFPKHTHHQIDASEVRLSGGDYAISGLEDLIHSNDNINKALDEAIIHGGDRDSWLCFAPGVESTIDITKILNLKGIKATCVHSKMTTKERNDNINGFKEGKYRCMVNNNVLTTGFDHPPIDMIIVLRHTKSAGLWVQMLGRGTRPSNETMKRDCLVLDFCGNTAVLGPIDNPNVKEPGKRKKRDSIAPMKVCGNEDCCCYNYASVRYCVQCGWEFPPPKDKIKDEASNLSLMSCQDEPVYELFDVNHVVYTLHQKRGSRNSMRVTYMCGLKTFNEWVCFDSDSQYVRHKVVQWWSQRIAVATPVTTAEALNYVHNLRKPTRIKVIVNRKYPEIVGASFAA